MGGPVSGARRISPASQSEPAGICPAPFVPGFPPLCGGNVRRTKGARGCRAKGRETCVEPTYTFSCPPQEVGYSASEARKADPRKAANSERRPQSSSRLPCPRSGDACRAGKRKLAVCNTLCAASDPSPGSTFSATRRGDGEGRSRGPGRGRRSRRGPVFTGPKTLAAGPSPGKARQQPRTNHRVGADIFARPKTHVAVNPLPVPFRNERGRERAKRDRRGMPGAVGRQGFPRHAGEMSEGQRGRDPSWSPGAEEGTVPFRSAKGDASERSEIAGVCPGRTRVGATHLDPTRPGLTNPALTDIV